MTFVPVNLKKLELDEKKKSISKWQSKEGWIYPDVKTTLQSNEHPKKLDQASLDKLNEVFKLNNFKFLRIFSDHFIIKKFRAGKKIIFMLIK